MTKFMRVLRIGLTGAVLAGVMSCTEDGDDGGGGVGEGGAGGLGGEGGSGGGAGGEGGDGGAGANCGNPDADPDCRVDLGEAECPAKGGEYGIHGDTASPFCLCPTSDAGCPCQGAADCEAACWVEGDEGCEGRPQEGTCAPYHPTLSCYCLIEAGEDGTYICP